MCSNMRHLAAKNVGVQRRSRQGSDSDTVDQPKMARNSCIKWTELPVCEIAAHTHIQPIQILPHIDIYREWPAIGPCFSGHMRVAVVCLWAPTKMWKSSRKMWKIERQLEIYAHCNNPFLASSTHNTHNNINQQPTLRAYCFRANCLAFWPICPTAECSS